MKKVDSFEEYDNTDADSYDDYDNDHIDTGDINIDEYLSNDETPIISTKPIIIAMMMRTNPCLLLHN